MLLQKFYGLIERTPFGKALDYQARLIERIDPNRIYPENIRSFFHVPMSLAIWLCEEAVREGIFEKRIGLHCPKCERMLMDVGVDEPPPSIAECEACTASDYQTLYWKPEECRPIVFYRMRQANGD